MLPQFVGLQLLLALGVGLLVSVEAQADTITNTAGFSVSSGDTGPFTTFVPNFDRTLGTLTGDSFIVSGSFGVSILYPNKDPGSSTGFFTTTVSVSGAQNVTFNFPPAPFTSTTNVISGGGSGTFSGTLTPAYVLSTQPGQLLDLTISISSAPTFTTQAVFGGATTSSGNFGGTITETFTYTPFGSNTVPEPTSLILLATTLAGIGLTRRRI